ncbi:MAG: tRNA (adenosine(37)-N6)-dimethylallyltransferase MiaA [Dysgonamonadaceae bacterium]|jgi:tRNA dimethylallyltransferase|nr:tRNA (adenosine(37)-N6)-dimethylallyltransferase MiaA [Dysgonamonadaceae bacterium]
MTTFSKNLIVLLGPTGVGKTELSLEIARKLGSPILSADSRQIYKGLTIGTAAPTARQLKEIKHYFVGNLELTDYYSASAFEKEVNNLLATLFEDNDTVLIVGGSMMYLDAVCKGIDELPDVDIELRNNLQKQFEEEGLDPIRDQLKLLDPDFYRIVDLKNPKRVIHALEICLMTGQPYSSLRTNIKKEHPFNIIKIGLQRERDELYARINERVDKMMANGFLEEARSVYPMRELNSLNTLGYKELFSYFDGECDLPAAIEKIKQNTRIYSRKQMTWFKKDPEITWFHPKQKAMVLRHIEHRIQESLLTSENHQTITVTAT